MAVVALRVARKAVKNSASGVVRAVPEMGSAQVASR
jgi:hypothetical protein